MELSSPQNIKISSGEEQKIISSLDEKHDPEAERMKRFLSMPDLSRTQGNPLAELVQKILQTERFSRFDQIQVPEIVPADISFDLFNFPADHPARAKSDTYYVDDNHILRTHTTVMWYYYLNQEDVKEKIKGIVPVGSISYGKVYRKDEIDRFHMNVFHQMDGWYLVPKKEKIITIDDLGQVLVEIAQAVFGKDVKYRFNTDTFPYTDPSVEMEIEVASDGVPKWVEVLGSGVVRAKVLNNLGVE